MKYTFRYLYRDNRDFSKHDAYVKLFGLTVPIIPTWVVLNFTNWSANTVTILGFIFGTTGVVLSYFFGIEYLLYGFLVFLVLDFVDGNVAKARGGGTSLGVILDMTVDRIVLLSSVFTLSFYHLNNEQKEESLFLLVYILTFVLLDVLQLAFLRGKGAELDKVRANKVGSNDFKNIFSSFLIWVPSRLSSYLIIVVIILATGSYTNAYIAGILCVLGEYITMFVKYSKMLRV